MLSIGILASSIAMTPVLADESDFGGKRVAAYWADWEYYYDSAFTHDKVDFSRLTHVNYAFAWTDEEGTIYFTDQYVFDGIGESSFSGGAGDGPEKCSPPFWHPYSSYDNTKHAAVCQGWNDDNAGFVKSVHDAGVKAILSVGGWTLSDRVSEMLEDADARANFIDNAVQILTDWSFDGIDLDFEYPGYEPNGGREIDKANYTLLLQELRQRFDDIEATTGQQLELTAAVSCGEAIANNAYEYEQLADLLDYVNLMAYDFGGDWDSVAQHNSPLYAYDGQLYAGFDADSCRAFWMTTGQVPADKIVLGMAHYGRSFQGATAIGDASGGHDSAHWGNDTETRYYAIVEKQSTDSSFHTAYDPVAHTHYGWFDDGGFISFEDTISIADRAQYVLDQGLAGVMIWQLHGGMLQEGGAYQYPLLDAAIGVLSGAASGDAGDGGDQDSGDGDGSGDDSGNDAAGGTCSEFVQPYAGDTGYQIGDKVTFDGKAYVSTFEPNWWSPADAPQYWESGACDDSVTDGSDDSDNDANSGDGVDGAAACSEFVQPYAGDPGYQIGDKVIFDGKAYVSTFEPNWWSPSAAPSYWAESSCD